MQAAAAEMKRGSGGRIVNTTGRAGLLGSYQQACHSAALAGVYGLTRAAAIELQQHRIAVNAIAPLARTRSTEELAALQGQPTLMPEYVAPATLFLASDLCGDWSGSVLAVEGGRVSVLQLVESRGRFKQSAGGPWTAEEIAEHWESIRKL
jgi:NAD(P)-dependent dehydrogenase (short-subunit alcohol dehydrogenase family)